MTAAELTPDEFAAAVAAVTTAFGDPTRREIYLFVRTHPDGVKAAEVAEQFALHPNVARHHLEKLAAGGYLDVELVRHESAGRPSKRYQATERRHPPRVPAPPRRPARHAARPRARAAARSTRPHELAEEVGYEYGRSIAARMEPGEGHRSVKAALASVADALTAHGFAAHAESHGNVAHARRRALPVRRGGQQVPARVVRGRHRHDQGHARRAVRRDAADIEQSRPGGDEHCVTASVTRARTSTTRRRRRCGRRARRDAPVSREHPADPGRLHAGGPGDTRRARRRARAGRGVLRCAAARGRVHVVGHRSGEHRDLGRRVTGRWARPRRHDRGRALVRARRDRTRGCRGARSCRVDGLGRYDAGRGASTRSAPTPCS